MASESRSDWCADTVFFKHQILTPKLRAPSNHQFSHESSRLPGVATGWRRLALRFEIRRSTFSVGRSPHLPLTTRWLRNQCMLADEKFLVGETGTFRLFLDGSC